MAGIRRRDLLAGAAGAAAIAGVGPGTAAPAGAATAETAPTERQTLGGRTIRLRAGTDLAAQLSPDGRQIAFQSYRDGVFDIWVIRPTGPGCAG